TRYPDVVRIILSGQSDPKLVFRAVPVAHQSLTKPFEAAKLIESIERALSFRKLVTDPKLRSVFGGDNRLPAAPETYSALTHLLSREDASISDVVSLVQRDTALAARVAQLGSSSFFGVPAGVRGLSGIVSYLGVELMKTLVLTVELTSVFAPTTAPGFSMTAFQSHSLRVAHIAQRMMERGSLGEDAFLAGILHDVGRLVLASRCPGPFAEALAEQKSSGFTLTDAERTVFGVTHAEAGAYLLGIWGLPLDLVDAVLCHHGEPATHSGASPIARVVYLANLLAHDPDAAIDDEEQEPASDADAASETCLSQFRKLARKIACAEAP
ncbi:MAG TPA: response regulator, partial [Polyangiaceae bacterium]|nr:response regulator [Polyangiaceae bacterium]